MSNQLELYQQVILEHNRKPKNFGTLESATHKAEGFNPICGDHFWVTLELDAEGRVARIAFDGSGCAISKASASMMTEAVKGKTEAEALALCAQFHHLVKGESPEDTSLGKLVVFANIWKYPARVKCAGLAWHALQGAFAKTAVVSTETDATTEKGPST